MPNTRVIGQATVHVSAVLCMLDTVVYGSQTASCTSAAVGWGRKSFPHTIDCIGVHCKCSQPFGRLQVVYSHVVSSNGSRSAAMLLTSATVHAGASGGAVVNADGCVVGIITSNARHSASGATIPNLNFAVAVDALRALWQLAAQPKGITHTALQRLDIKDAALLDIWTISKPPESPFAGGGWGKLRLQGSARLAELLSNNRLGVLLPSAGGADESGVTSKL